VACATVFGVQGWRPESTVASGNVRGVDQVSRAWRTPWPTPRWTPRTFAEPRNVAEQCICNTLFFAHARTSRTLARATLWRPRTFLDATHYTVRGWQVSRDLNDSEPRASCAQGREPARRRRLATALAHDMITFITPKNKTMCLTQNNSGMQNNSRMQGFRTSLPPSLFCASRLNGGRTQRRHTQAATEAPQAATEAPQAATQVRP
jgi:hypothetical protein